MERGVLEMMCALEAIWILYFVTLSDPVWRIQVLFSYTKTDEPYNATENA